jgi:Ca2+-binding RTX toxin-like protein
MVTYLEAAEREGASAVNTRGASATSLQRYIEHMDDGRVTAHVNARGRELGILPERWSRLPLAAKIGVLGLLGSTVFGIRQANAAPTVAERNQLLQDTAVMFALEVGVLAAGLGLAPAVLVTTVGYGLYKYATDAGTRQSVNDFLERHAALAPQVVTRLFRGESLFPGAVGTQLVPAPDARIVPLLTGLNPVAGLPTPGAQSLDLAEYVTTLQNDWGIYSTGSATVGVTRADAEAGRSPYPVQAIFAGSVPIAFIVTEAIPAYERADGTRVVLPVGSLVLVNVSDPNAAGVRGWNPISVGGTVGPVTNANVQQMGEAIYNTLRRNASLPGMQNLPLVETRQSGTQNVAVTTTVITQGPDRYILIDVAERGYDIPVNSATPNASGTPTIVRDRVSTQARTSNAPPPVSVTREVVTAPQGPNDPQAGRVLHRYTLSRDAQGNVTYTIDGQAVSAEVARSPEHRAAFEKMAERAQLARDIEATGSSDAGFQMAESAARDMDHARAQAPGPVLIDIRQVATQFGGNTIVNVSARLVANRLAERYTESGRQGVPQDEYLDAFKAGVEQQVKQIQVAGQIGGVFGSVLGRALAGQDEIAGMVLGGVLGSLTTSVGQAIATGAATDSLSQGFRTGLAELPANLGRAGVGALSSLLTAELIKAVGIDGFAGEIANTAAGAVVGQILGNLSGLNGAEAVRDLLSGVNATLVFTAVGSFLGSRLASELVKFDTVGGQIGSSIGSAVGSIAAVALVTGGGALAGQFAMLGAFAGPVGAAIGAFVGFIAGGLIGSVFAGTPRSGADVAWDDNAGEFQVDNVYSRKGGSKDAARSVASVVSESLNGFLTATGGTLLNPEAVQTGNYGMRKEAFVYRPVSTRDKDAITRSFKGDDAAQRLISYGISQALADSDFQLAGGDVYVKRALYNSPARSGSADGTVDLQALYGDLTIARDWSFYRNNPGAIEALSAGLSGAEREAYLAGWVATAARAADLGLDKRHAADWFGGFQFLLKEAGATAGTASFYFDYEFGSDKYSRALQVGRFTLTDAVDVAAQTLIEAGSGNDVIDLRSGMLADQRSYTVDGRAGDDIAVAGEDYVGRSNAGVAVTAGGGWAELAIATIANQAGERSETFGLTLVNADGVSLVGRDAQITIVSADDRPHLQVGRSYAAEGDGYAVFRIGLSRAAATDIAMALSVAGGTAALSTDFSADLEVSSRADGGWVAASTAQIAAGAREVFVRIRLVADNGIGADGAVTGQERSETLLLGAKVTSGASALANGNNLVTGIATIFDGSSDKPLAWADDLIVHAGQEARVSVGLSRALSGGAQLFASTTDRRSRKIEISATVLGGGGNDVIHASALGDNLMGGAGDDRLFGGRLDDWILGGDGSDVLDAGAESGGLGGDGNYLDGGAGNDTINGREGSDWLEGGDGTDRLVGGAGGDILAGGAGAGDDLEGGSGDDIYLVRRGDGADMAEDQADAAPVRDSTKAGDAISQRFAAIAAGLIRRDWLARSSGVSQGKIAGGEDSIHFGVGIELGDVQLAKAANGRDLIVRLSAVDPATGKEALTGDTLTVSDWFSDPFKRVEWLKFADGTEVRIGDVTSFIVGTGGADVLIGTGGKDFVYGGAGNDELYLLAGDDIGSGGTGDDMVSGGADNDLVVGGLGADKLIGGSGNDALSGDASADDLYGGKGNDILSGGRDDGDMLAGGAGDDRFKFARGDGHDVIIDDYSDNWVAIWHNGQWVNGYVYNAATSEITAPDGSYVRKNFGTAAEPDLRWVGRYDFDEQTRELKRFAPPVGAATTVSNKGVDTIEFALDINIQDIILTRPAGSDDIRLTVSRENSEGTAAGASDSVTLKDYYDVPGAIEKIAFYQTGEIDISATGFRLVAGTDGADGSDAAPLAGGAGNDWMSGGAGDDVLAAGAGDDIVVGNGGSDRLKGESGNDVLYGGAGNDVLDGGVGDDVLSGGAGADTASYASAAGGVSAFLTEPQMNRGEALLDTYDSIENLTGSGGADTLGGDDGDNELAGGMGNDLLLGGRGSDTYVWNIGDGSDSIDDAAFTARQVIGSGGELLDGYDAQWTRGDLRSGSGSNARYYWKLVVTGPDGVVVYSHDRFAPKGDAPTMPAVKSWPADGWMDGLEATGVAVGGIVYDRAVDAGEADAIELGAGISLSDLAFERDGNDLVISYVKVDDGNNGGGNALGASRSSSLAVRGHFTANGRIESLIFADGLSIALDSILAAATSDLLTGTAGADLMTGQRGVRADHLDGGAGDDVLSGGEGDDRLLGGAGDDVLEGGAGADTLDGGANTLYDPAASADASAKVRRGDEVRYATSLAAVAIDLASTAAQTGGDAQGDILRGIENVTGSALADKLLGSADANRLRGLAGDDEMDGRGGDDVLVGDLGNDRIEGGAGEDNLSGGEGDDRLSGGDGKDLLAGDDGNDELLGGAGDDILSADAGNDRLDGGAGKDSLSGGEGADTLLGGDGNDTLSGEAGNDLLDGGAGDDGYSFKLGFGEDVLTDTAGKNDILFDASISHERLWLQQSGADLLISVRGTSDTLTVRNFFAGVDAGRIYSIQTSTHRLFLHHPDTRNFIAAMTQASTGGVPPQIPQSVALLMPRYWHAGSKATPYAEGRSLSIDEDNATGSVAIGAIDHDDNIVNYAVGTGPAHGTVAVDQAGAFVFTPTANSNGADSFTLIITDADKLAREITVSVAVAAVDDAPVIEDAVLAVDEQALRSTTKVGDLVRHLAAREVDGEAIVFSLSDDAQGRFAISAEGKLTVRDADRLNHEDDAAHQVTVRVTDAVGTWTERSFTVAVRDVNEANALPAAYGWNVGENSAVGTVVGRVGAHDADKPDAAYGEQRYYFWYDAAAHELSRDDRYRMDAVSGEISVAGIVDHEAPMPVSQHEVIARDDRGAAGGHQSHSSVTIAITDFNEANAIPAAYDITFAENEAAGLRIGAVAATDEDNPGTAFASQRYFFWDGSNASSESSDGRFTIDAVSGAIFANRTFDHESDVVQATYQVVARDNGGDAPFNHALTSVTINLSNVNEAPQTPVLDFSAGRIGEGAAAGTVVARFTLADPDRTVPALVPETNPGNLFSVAEGELRLTAALDFEDLVELGFAVGDADQDRRNDITIVLDLHASDGALRSADSTRVTVVLEDANEAPTAFGFEPALIEIAERDRIGTGQPLPAMLIGAIDIADPDTPGFENARYSYTLDDDRFEVVGNLVRLREGVAFDFEQQEQISLTVVAVDQSVDPLAIERTFTFAIGDRDDILDGTQDPELLEGQKGRDIIHGLAGDDELRGHAGNDDLYGDDGADRLLGGDGADRIEGGADADRLEGCAGEDRLAGGTGNDTLLGGGGADSVFGGEGDDIVIVDEDGGTVLDRIDGGAGSDGLSYRHFAGGVDADLAAALVAGDAVAEVENIEGTLHADSLAGNDNGNLLSGLSGDDVLVGRGGDDVLLGGSGNDDLAGGAGGDILDGGSGGDRLGGGGGNDTLLGGGDGDVLLGEAGDDYIEGGAGNDIADGGAGDDAYIIDRRSHHDTIFNYDATGDDIDVIGFKDTHGLIEERDLWFERQGDDLLVTVIGADATVLVKKWYVDVDPGGRANHRIDFFIAGEKYSRDTDVEGLVSLMSQYKKPADEAELEQLLADPDFEVKVATYFGINAPPTISGLVDQRFDEGGSVVLTLAVADDITPKAGIVVTAKLLSGEALFDPGAMVLSTVGSDGRLTLQLAPGTHRAGSAVIELTAEDAGGISVTQQIVLTVDPVATTPLITQLTAGAGTSGGAGIALSLSVEFPDRDGSELHEILIGGVPTSVSLSRGSFDSASGLWKLAPDQLAGLTVLAPQGWSRDLQLTVTARASEGGKAAEAVATTNVVLNAPPTDIRFDGSISESSANGAVAGRLNGIDPDTGETLTYTLLDGAEGRFALAPDGTLSVADGSKLDFETATNHSIKVRVTDSFDEAIERVVTLQIANVNEANRLPARYSLALDENLLGGIEIGRVEAGDDDAPGHAFGQQAYFFQVGDSLRGVSADGLFAIDRATGAITTTRALDFEKDQPGDYSVVALDNLGGAGANSALTTVAIALRNLNEANGLAESINLSVLENQGVGTLVGTVKASDFDSDTHPFGEQRYYFLVNGAMSETSADQRFTIDPVSGDVRTARLLDRESADASTSHVVVARDNRGAAPFNQVTAGLGIAVANENETPHLPAGTARTILDEAGGANPAVAGALIGSYSLSDPDGPAPGLVFAPEGNLNDWFRIGGNEVRFAPGVSLTFRAAREWAESRGVNIGDVDGDGRHDVLIGSVVVRASDGERESADVRTDIYIEDVAEGPSVPVPASRANLSETLVGQPPHSGQVIATFTQSDPDGPTPALEIVGGNLNNWFTTVGDQLVFTANVDFTAEWLRQNAGTLGVAGAFASDIDDDGLKEIRVATLDLVSRDNDGGRSGAVKFDVLIEDTPEAAAFTASSLSMALDEGTGAHIKVGTVAATDVDGPLAELRYSFDGAPVAWNGALGRSVSASADGKLLMDTVTGEVFTAAGAPYEADSGAVDLSYQVRVVDRLGDRHSRATTAALQIRVNPVNEPHSLVDSSGAIDEVEGLPPLVERFNLRNLMLSDPEGRNMVWTFANGSSVAGIWTLTSDGKLALTDGRVDYEQLTTRYETTEVYDERIGETVERTVMVRDHSLATIALAVKARDPETGVEREATFTATVRDVNEGPVLISSRQYYIKDDDDEDNRFGVLTGRDPETGGAARSFAIDYTTVRTTESQLSPGSSGDVDNTDYPYVYVNRGNELWYEVRGDGEWEGGIKYHPTLGGRWYFQYDYSFEVVMTDVSGATGRERINVTFLKHGVHSAPPIVFDLDGDGLELVSLLGSTVRFDMDADGLADRTGWVAADDGVLALDRNGNGTIDDIGEISFASDLAGAASDLEGLGAYDSNGDGRIGQADARFADFRVWRDLNQDGVSQAGELVGLVAAGVASITLAPTLTGDGPPSNDNVLFATASYTRVDGGTGTVGDVFLAYERTEPSIAAPIILDFDGDGTSLVSLAASTTRFDMDGDGSAERTAWFETGDAMLALDRNGDGAITDIAEISFVGDKQGAKTDLEGLAAFDTSGDGILEAGDKRFAAFRLWFDANGNGTSDAGELKSLAEAGVVGISLSATAPQGDAGKVAGSIIYGRGSFAFADGKLGTLIDAGLAFLPEDGATAPAVATWTGAQAPSFGAAARGLSFASQSLERKAKKYMVSAVGGQLVLSLRKAAVLDPRAGSLTGATILNFRDGAIGMLAPIILDLDGDGVELRGRKDSKARFDMNGDGVRDDTGWAGRNDGFLVLDRNGDGRINDGSELSFLTENPAAKSDLQALASLDSNRDGAISAADKRFGELKLWVDRNGNGATDEGELKALAEHGIASIGLAGLAGEAKGRVGENMLLATSTFTRSDGSVGTVGDAALAFKPAGTGIDARVYADGLDPFALFANEVGARAVSGTDGPGYHSQRYAGHGDADARRLSLMAQDMAAFGPSRGEGLLERRDRAVSAPLDYFAG